MASEPETLDPRYVTDAVGMRTTRLVHAGLVKLDPQTLAPLPYLAESLTWRDARTLAVTLRAGVHFHSGAPLTSHDVRATLRAFSDAKVASRHAGVVSAIGDIETPDARTLVIHLKRAHATLETDLELPILRADQAWLPPRPSGDLDGLGPWRITSLRPGEIHLEASTTGLGPKPAHDLTILRVRDENGRALRLVSGKADVVQNGISPTLLPALIEEKSVHVARVRGANLTYLVPETERGVLADPHLRRAVSLGIDRVRLAATLMAGEAEPAASLLPPWHFAYARPRVETSFDPEAARRELELAARRAPITLLVSHDRLRQSLARVLAQELGKLGIAVDVLPLDLGALLARLGRGDFDLALLQLPELTEPNVFRVFMHSTSIPPAGSNRGRIRDGQLDRLLDDGAETQDIARRRQIYSEVSDRVLSESFLIPLFHERHVALTSARAAAYLPSAEGRWLGLTIVP